MKPPNAERLAMRDPAMAALLGAIPGANFGAEFGDEFGDDDEYGAEFGDDEYGAEFGDDEFFCAEFGDDEFGDDEFGDEFGAFRVSARGSARGRAGANVRFPGARRPGRARPAPRPVARPAAPRPTVPIRSGPAPMPGGMKMAPNPRMMAVWNQMQRGRAMTAARNRLIEPNRGSSVKVEKYVFPISQQITLGTAVALSMQGQPDTTIRPKRLTMNAPAPMFAFIFDIKIANVSVAVGGGQQDAFDYNSQGVGQSLDLPTISPANRVTITGSYTGFLPPGYSAIAVQFTATFKGPATIVA